LKEYTEPGDIELVPFRGFGTILFVAKSMDRIPVGIEFDRE
jgi:DNA modification methylase